MRAVLVQLPIPQASAMAPTGNVPLAAGSLVVAARTHGLEEQVDVRLLPPHETDRLGDAQLADRIAQTRPDYLGLSLYLWNVERSLHLARSVKERSPETRIIIGGPEVGPDNPFVLMQSGYDVAVTGEAEDTFATLLGTLAAGGDPHGLPGVSVRGPLGMSPFGPAPNANFPIDTYPSPYLTDVLPVEADRSTYLETVRGCRSHCTFCFYPRSSSVLRTLSAQASGDLVARLGEAGATELVFLDPTFNHRPELVDLLEALARANPDRRMRMFGEVRAEGLSEQHAALLAAAGFNKLEIGLQSVNLEALRRTRRGGSPGKVAAAARLLHAHGIRLLVDLMIGLPGDDSRHVSKGIDYLLEHGLGDEAQVFPLAILPGTAMRADASREGLVFDSEPPYLIRRTPLMDGDTIDESMREAERRLGRRLTEPPRPHLVDPSPNLLDAVAYDLDRHTSTNADAASPGARHLSLWIAGSDLWSDRETIARLLRGRMAIDPYCTLDVVLCPRQPFPLDLLDRVRNVLEEGPASYATRIGRWRSENALRRIAIVLRAGLHFPRDYVETLRAAGFPVFVEHTLPHAAALAPALGHAEPGVRIVGDWPREGETLWRRLVDLAEPDAVAFADRTLEERWVREVLGLCEVGE